MTPQLSSILRRLTVCATMIIALAAPSWAASVKDYMTPERAELLDSLKRALATIDNTADSLPVLCDIFDLLPRSSESERISETAYFVAKRLGDEATALDIIRNQANRRMHEDSVLRILRARALSWPESESRKETLTFIKMMDNFRRARFTQGSRHTEELNQFLDDINNSDPQNVYERIEKLHGICMFLSYRSQGKILSAYMDTLGTLVYSLPPQAYSIRNAYNVHAASSFVDTYPEKSIAADMRTLKNIDRLSRYYKNKGRQYRSYDESYYTVYARLLSNFAYLSDAQIEEYYKEAIRLKDSNGPIEMLYNRYPAPDIFYAFYKKDFHKAVALIKKSKPSANRQSMLLRYLIASADSIGDTATALDAYRRYTKLLEDEITERAHGDLRELQVGYANYEMKHKFNDLERQRAESKSKAQRGAIVVGSITLIILLVLLLFLFRQYRKNRRLVKSLADANSQLKAESQSLRIQREENLRAKDRAEKANNLKNDFIKNMTREIRLPLDAITEYARLIADCSQGNVSKQLERFNDMIDLNAELLTSIVNDVLSLTDLESESTAIHPRVVNLRVSAATAVENARRRVAPGVVMKVDSDFDLDVFTDETRLQQVLNNLLTNAAKFTRKGSITVSYSYKPENGMVEISVTDTGIGINPENSEKIFERFVKLDRDTQGAGLGLTISRLIAERLGGTLRLDTSYEGPGSRFIFTLPKK